MPLINDEWKRKHGMILNLRDKKVLAKAQKEARQDTVRLIRLVERRKIQKGSHGPPFGKLCRA